jgi:hypothetical protein
MFIAATGMSQPNKYFPVLLLHRNDFAAMGYDADGLSDEDMETIADDLAHYIWEKLYVGLDDELTAHARTRNLPRWSQGKS